MSNGVIVLDGQIAIQDHKGNVVDSVTDGCGHVYLAVSNPEQTSLLQELVVQLKILNKHMAQITEIPYEPHHIDDVD